VCSRQGCAPKGRQIRAMVACESGVPSQASAAAGNWEDQCVAPKEVDGSVRGSSRTRFRSDSGSCDSEPGPAGPPARSARIRRSGPARPSPCAPAGSTARTRRRRPPARQPADGRTGPRIRRILPIESVSVEGPPGGRGLPGDSAGAQDPAQRLSRLITTPMPSSSRCSRNHSSEAKGSETSRGSDPRRNWTRSAASTTSVVVTVTMRVRGWA